MGVSDESLRGKPIVAADGQLVGELVVLIVECETWRVETLRARLNRAIADRVGADRSIFHAGMLEIPVRMVQSVGDAIVLSVAVDDLRDVMQRGANGGVSGPED